MRGECCECCRARTDEVCADLRQFREIAEVFRDASRREFAARCDEDRVVACDGAEDATDTRAIEFNRERIAVSDWCLQDNECAANVDRNQFALENTCKGALWRDDCGSSAWQLIATWAFEDADFGEITRERRLRGFHAFTREELGEFSLAPDLAGGDQVADDGVAARFHKVRGRFVACGREMTWSVEGVDETAIRRSCRVPLQDGYAVKRKNIHPDA